ncbi:MAG: heat-inducible transcription repressor HrcA [Dehalococcoidia bacterium]|nr:heat-inducible transcription repressor HrcA [Dehalococcoidia bacterium]
MSLTSRREFILRTIVSEYIAGGNAVASRTIALTNIHVSPATIRNDVTGLEEEGYISRPHSSAGAVPTDKAYRYYVESLTPDVKLPLTDQMLIDDVCHDASEELDKRLRLIATLLAHFVHSAAIVTQPKATHARLKHIQLVSIDGVLTLMILVLSKPTVVRQKTIALAVAPTQESLTEISNRLSARLGGMSKEEVKVQAATAEADREIVAHVADMMAEEDKPELGRTYVEGLHLMLSHPEFANNRQTLTLLRLVERDNWIESAVGSHMTSDGVKVMIGRENKEEALQDLSLVVGNYGSYSNSRGLIGVIGPKRMDYGRAISSVNYLAALLSESICESYNCEGV